MSLDTFSDPVDTPSERNSELYRGTLARFNQGYKMDHDTMNVWSSLGYVIPGFPQAIEKIKPREHYEQYVRRFDQLCNEGGKYADMIMQRSDREAVAAFDRLVDEFNADLERIKQTQDFQALKSFVAKAKELIYQKN